MRPETTRRATAANRNTTLPSASSPSRWPPARDRPPRSLALLGIALGAPIVGLALPQGLSGIGLQLPLAAVDLSFSFVRMVVAYAFSLVFALGYGYFAATRRVGERILIPVLDILQSIPILGFFPVAIVFFVSLTASVGGPGSALGPNLASIFLIFTSMAWNMAFGVYESLKALPSDLKDAADAFAVGGGQRLRDVLFPATVNRLVYNSVLSWTAGWFYLVAAEVFSVGGGKGEQLPGIGSYLATAALSGNSFELISGFSLLVVLIALLDMFAWRPLSRWAERFRYDQGPAGEAVVETPRRGAVFRRAAGAVARGVRSGVSRVTGPLIGFADSVTHFVRPARPRTYAPAAVRLTLLGGSLVLVWLLLIYLVETSFHILAGPIDPTVRAQIGLLPIAVGESFVRVAIAYLLSLAVALPLAVLLYRRPRTARVGLPVVEVVASVPATALFPILVFALVPFVGSELTSVLMLVTGMVWYLFFNILSGLRSIPPDLNEAALSFGLDRKQYYRRLVFPAIFPAFITGSITAFGGGWNALIVAEFLASGTQSFQVLGVGELLNVGNKLPNGAPLLLASLLTLVIVVVALNELLWKPLYRRAINRYRYD